MKYLYNILLLLIIPSIGWSQTDTPLAKPLKIEATNKLNKKKAVNKGNVLNIPSVINNKPKINFSDSLTRNQIQMLDNRNLVNSGTGLKIDPKVKSQEKEGSEKYFPDIYLGDIKESGEYIIVVFKDSGAYIDDDIVEILFNDQIIGSNIFLTGEFEKGIKIKLEKGFNKIDFKAVTNGVIPPNSAEFKIFNDQKKAIYNELWFLSAGSKATLIITKE